MSLDAALLVARSGLAAVQRGLAQASQNVANAETPGYTRKAVPQQALTVGDSPAGLRSGEAQRSVDTALLARLDASRATAAAATLAERLNGVSDAIGAARQQAQDSVVAEVAKANAALRDIADLTTRL